ncbi:MAG: AAA family ATPase, partial [Actinomycetota bacterium]|nr:AAA family ATPase [Actinomycetota bacterium]
MICAACGAENRPGRKFCSRCGNVLAVACPTCGAANDAGDLFCGECGTALDQAEPSADQTEPAAAPEAERRLVSVLFADLVGFTALSEKRDAEEVRDLLSRYFDTSRRLIGRYGGTVEKFIGDAVMAVWGTPVAKEDDAERAVRAALELAESVATLGEDVGGELQARVGVLTGEAAVTVGAEGQGMVAGDLVNTASRIQSAAEPGSVLVGERTRRASDAAIAYEDAGTHLLKGKEEPVPLWRAVRVVAGKAGALRAADRDAPFVGRQREMRLIKELFHASAEDRTASLVSVTGVAGVGKTRLSWEFEKYIDGLAEDVWWHRGRCLAYGEGVAYWALAEMVRGRAGILEGEAPESASGKVRLMVERHVPDPEERAWIEPRLAHLLGLEERTAVDQSDLFSAWRLFFERLADEGPVEMVFEDLQWADSALLDFIEYLLEWSKDHPLFILTVSRPELADRRPTWGAGKRNFTSLALDPLSPDAMEQLIDGLAPGLPDELRQRIRDRAEGIPLYAVETVRMLLDRGILQKEGDAYRTTGSVQDLEVPETLHALIAARLDGLAPEEARLVQDASVLGKSFSRPALAAVSGMDDAELETPLTSLVRKELLSVHADPRSPERGQYGFLQDLVRKVAYDTLSMKERKTRHLAACEYLTASWGGDEDEIVEVVSSHLLEAYRAAPEAADAPEIKVRACRSLSLAGERAASLAATEEAQSYFERAAELTDDPVRQAELLERAGRTAWVGGRADDATRHLEAAIELFEAEGRAHPAARVSAILGEITWAGGHIEQAVERMERSFEVLNTDEPDADLATLAAQLGRFHFFMGHLNKSAERLDQALQMAESMWLPETLSMALNSKGGLVLDMASGRPHEGLALLRHALTVALENDAPVAALRAYYNLSNSYYYRDQWAEALPVAEDGLELARRRGDRQWEWGMLTMIAGAFFARGDWDAALEFAAEVPHLEQVPATRFAAAELVLIIPAIRLARGQPE